MNPLGVLGPNDCTPVPFSFLRTFGPKAAVFLAFIIKRILEARVDPKVGIEISMDEIFEKTALTHEMQVTARRKLGDVLLITRKRLEHKTFYGVNESALAAILEVQQ